MYVKYDRFFAKLKNEKITQKEIKEKAKISGGTMTTLIHNGSITTDTICKICDYFHCMPEDIMEFIPDSENNDAEKAAIQAQISELQAKLKTM